jgi:hypothetical protein
MTNADHVPPSADNEQNEPEPAEAEPPRAEEEEESEFAEAEPPPLSGEAEEIPVTPTPTEPEEPVSPATPDIIQLEILSVRVSQVEPSSGSSRYQKKLLAEVRFRISGTDAESITRGNFPFQVSGYTVDLNTNAANPVTLKQETLQNNEFEYSSQYEFPVPKPGRYELHNIVLLLPPYTRMVCYPGPILNIVP